jgi:hypothetical protein
MYMSGRSDERDDDGNDFECKTCLVIHDYQSILHPTATDR